MPYCLKCSPDVIQCISSQYPQLFADLSAWLTDRHLLLPPKMSQLHGKQLENLSVWLHQIEGGAPLHSAGWCSKAGIPTSPGARWQAQVALPSACSASGAWVPHQGTAVPEVQSTAESMGISPGSSLSSRSGVWSCLNVLLFLCPPITALLAAHIHVWRHDLAAAVALGEAGAPTQRKWQTDFVREQRCWGWDQLTFSLFFNPRVDFLSRLFWCCLKVNLLWLCFVVVLTELYVCLKNNKIVSKQVLY